MKKIWLIFGLLFAISANAKAELYHNIDIDEVYKNGDWDKRGTITEIIDDYSFIKDYREKLNNCKISDGSNINDNAFDCLQNINQKIMKRFYNFNYETNIKNYDDFVKSTFAAYGNLYCLNKYSLPSGTMCRQEYFAETFNIISYYINELLNKTEANLKDFNFLKNYK